jgi:alkanesulfonate monooxygenase SsuD/methylene tetrahydromethanopterin reductase-like flavin-dependent oxidoreductase (luciferase family)
MHFGLFSLMAQRDRSVSPRQLYQEMVEQVKMAEQIGFDIAWFAEHHFSNYCLCRRRLRWPSRWHRRRRRSGLAPQ